ncbi:MAG TPA: rubredoxin [Rhodocyclaceae bacterium]|jgi:rubredoxin-NAD+ reductase|nr:rubredoxin [Rhodocyclaceae bacterium]
MSEREFKLYRCLICGYVYDEALGDPEHGLEPGTRWEDVPNSWICPECDVGKDDFEMMEI